MSKINLDVDRPDGVRRLGQALWMMIGRVVGPNDLVWARAILGPDGDIALWKALCQYAALTEPDFVLRPIPLSTFLADLWEGEQKIQQESQLVWTLPPNLSIDGIAPDGYLRAAIQMIESAATAVKLVAPYFEPMGMRRLHQSLLGALHRGVSVVVLTHDIEDLSSLASSSLESLRRESAGLDGKLTVFTASKMPEVLLHLKIVVVDGIKAIVGSANVTGKGFGANLEAGVVLGSDAAREIEQVVQATIEKRLVNRAYPTQED